MENISQRLVKYIDYKGISAYRFCKDLGFSNAFLKNSKHIGSDKVGKILNYYSDINPLWLLTGRGEMVLNIEKRNVQKKVIKKNDNLNDNLLKENEMFKKRLSNKETSHLEVQEKASRYTQPKYNYQDVIEINPTSLSNTLIADAKASAGFGAIMNSPKSLELLPAMGFPFAPLGLNVAFQISGDSMHPTIRHLDYIAGNQILDYNDIRDGHVYILIDKEDGAICKRVSVEDSHLVIKSDNSNYGTYTRSLDQILGVFKAFYRLSSDFRPYYDDLRASLDRIEDRLNKAGI